MIPFEEDDDEELERMWNSLTKAEQAHYHSLAESLAPHELIAYMLEKASPASNADLPTPTAKEMPSFGNFDEAEEITQRRMKKLLG